MKIWIDILTPKQILFFEPMIKKLGKKHKILCTTRKYREVDHLVKIRKIRVKTIGKHGGFKDSEKLKANIHRMKGLIPIIENFKPDVVMSFCSPDASRIAFGLKIKHIAFCDAPHADAVMRLTIPFIQKLLIPWIIPKKEFTKYGISPKNIIQYRAIDAALIISQKPKNKTIPEILKKGTNVLFRTHESNASYVDKKIDLKKIIKQISEIKDVNIIVLGRYSKEIQELKNKISDSVFVLNKPVDSGEILNVTDIFIGSGGTMTAESALRGIPTFSYNAVPNIIEQYLVKKKLVTRIENSKKINEKILNVLNNKSNESRNRARKELRSMENPIVKLEQILGSLNE